ncbi:interleukin-1 receptor-associated kinase 4-like [Centruroides sculpturatus]|uniref:interleukin-1 receptor-associated kinase 4-like n=1 Tax=Centruroides sculpturatus TaxID=218467 RepID=UPI000C6ED58F|nr:interleukin-1 receptor-associated kinase 4-like [Centruroides sculpturatus]
MHPNFSTNTNLTFQSSKGETISANTELRHLPYWAHNRLVGLLSSNNDVWKEFASMLPNLDKEGEPLLSYDNIRNLELQWNRPGNSPGNALLKHWYHSGRKRPTVAHLLDVFIKMQFYRAADFVSQELLRGEPASSSQPILTQTVSNENDSETNSLCNILKNQQISETQTELNNIAQDKNKIQNLPSVHSVENSTDKEIPSKNTVVQSPQTSKQKNDSEDLSLHTIPHFRYRDLYQISKQFTSVPVSCGGSKLGEGAFGEVYLGKFGNGLAAIKRIKTSTKQFTIELQVLIKYKHKNLLQLLGYSSDGPAPCLVYEYMENGSLQNHLDWKVF